MALLTSRRTFITGLSALIAAPAIVRASSLMPVRGIVMDIERPLVPATTPDIYAELARVTRKAFLPHIHARFVGYGGGFSNAEWIQAR